MKGMITIKGHKANIEFDAKTETYTGTIPNLGGGITFYGRTFEDMQKQGEEAVALFMDVCGDDGH